MPQLDSFTFLSQLFWLIIFFFIFYSFILVLVIPSLAFIIKFRFKKKSFLSLKKKNLNVNQIINDYDFFLINFSEKSRFLFNESIKSFNFLILKDLNFIFTNNFKLSISLFNKSRFNLLVQNFFF